jgi:hypothetical protein
MTLSFLLSLAPVADLLGFDSPGSEPAGTNIGEWLRRLCILEDVASLLAVEVTFSFDAS